jgi:hypothetical protein
LIKYNYEVSVNENRAKLNKDIFLFRGNRNIHYYFSIKGARFAFEKEGDLIENANAIYAAVTVIKPNGVEVANAIAPVENGLIHLKVTEDLIDEEVEIGDFDLVFDLFDDSDGAVTIPKIKGQFHVQERPCTTSIGTLSGNVNVVNQAVVDLAIATQENEQLIVVDDDGKYVKTTWAKGNKISVERLNKMEEGIYNNSSQLKDIEGKQIILEKDDTSMNGIDDTTHDTLTTTDKTIIGGINEVNSQCKDIAKKIEQGGTGGGTATIPDNIVLFQDDNSTETTEDYIPLLSSNGTEYRLTINDSGIPVVKDSSNKVIFTCGTGGSSSGGGTDIPGTPEGEIGKITSGVACDFEWTVGKAISDIDGSETNSPEWVVSKYLPLTNINYLKCKNSTGGQQKFNAFYDSDKTFISSSSIEANTSYKDIPENAYYVRISLSTVNKDKLTIIPYTNPSQSWVANSNYNLNLISNKYVNGDNFTDYANWSMTDYLECFGVTKLSITGNTAQTIYCAFYDQGKARLSSFTVTADDPCEIEVPKYACYFVISNTTDAMNSINVTPIV